MADYKLTDEQEIYRLSRKAAEAICLQSQTQHPQEVDDFYWDKSTVGKLTCLSPLPISDVSKVAPQLTKFLISAIPVSDNTDLSPAPTLLTEIGYIHNFLANQLTFWFQIIESNDLKAQVGLQLKPSYAQIYSVGDLTKQIDFPDRNKTQERFKPLTEELLALVTNASNTAADYTVTGP